jgi:hypothetical protein
MMAPFYSRNMCLFQNCCNNQFYIGEFFFLLILAYCRDTAGRGHLEISVSVIGLNPDRRDLSYFGLCRGLDAKDSRLPESLAVYRAVQQLSSM